MGETGIIVAVPLMRASPGASGATEGMCCIPGGEFWMGSEEFYPEELPVRRVRVEGFWIDPHPVTVGEFRRFVEDTGYVTLAERCPDPADYPGVDPVALVAGSAVFQPTDGLVSARFDGVAEVCAGGLLACSRRTWERRPLA
jgi:formylglycine-generating enzyme required for sulfatase activity